MNKKIIIGIIVAVVIPAAVYAGSPLFINETINEPLPSSAIIKTSEVMEKSETMEKSDTMMEKSGTTLALSGSFVGVNDGIHNAEGIAKVIPLDDGGQILRLEEFKSTNGPDLYVYLATDEKATDYVSLGELKANIGNQNYEIPEGTDLSKYDTALVWCKQFSVLFGHANLS
ncbi:MAG: DM13 domain-containing protein [Candidatus Nitrosotenuis sp.]